MFPRDKQEQTGVPDATSFIVKRLMVDDTYHILIIEPKQYLFVMTLFPPNNNTYHTGEEFQESEVLKNVRSGPVRLLQGNQQRRK